MKKFIPSIFAIVAFLVSFNAFAAPVECKDKDGDKFAVCDASCNVLPAGTKCGDCDDDHAFINPGVNEVGNPALWDDGVDNDCKGGDLVSMKTLDRQRFEKGLNRSIPAKSPQELNLQKIIIACQGGVTANPSSHCKVDWLGGKLNPDPGYGFVDADCSGKYKVVDQAELDRIAELERRGAGCKNKKPVAPANGNSVPATHIHKAPAPVVAPTPGAVTPTDPNAPKAPAKAARGVDYSAPIAKAQATADGAQQAVVRLKDTVDGQSGHLSALDQAIADQKTAISAETERATAAEGRIDTKAQTAIDRSTEAVAAAEAAKKTAEELEKKGFFGELSLGGATLVSHDAHIRLTQDSGTYKKGDVLQMRGNVAPGGYVGLNVGYANEDGRFNGFFNLLPLADEGPKGYESSIAYQGGVEATFTAFRGFGVHALFLQHDAGGSVVGANSYSRGVGGGLSFNSTTVGSNFKVGFQGRATIGGESYGAGKGSDTALFAGVTLGINFGFGPK
ncbi:MAG: putative metal-binding motif-containing protein [Candidatus Uhrbacteria bacterium]|nr:putative metal-binding motif-containing protein [Candidatus Uhrbacteria bacterium]